MKYLPIGSVVKLKQGNHLLMITARFPLYNNEGTIGYFEYLSCLYPEGINERESYFFNHEDIEEILFEGYNCQLESKLQEKISESLANIVYPRLTIL